MSVNGGDDVAYSTTTDGFGFYVFANLPSGNYAVTVDTASLPAGLRNTVDPEGADDSAAGFDLTLGEADGTLDFGYVGTNSIGDTVFVDTDADGVQDAGEPGLGGVTLTLRRDVDNNGSFETTVGIRFSAGAGTYQFDRLPGGSYRVDVTSPSGQTATTPDTVEAPLADSQAIDTADFGFAPPTASAGGTIGDLVWNDADSDGVLDAGEVGVAGVTVTLRADPDGDGTYGVVATQVTAANGSYSFSNLPPDRYRLAVSVPAGSFATTPPAISVNLGAGQSSTPPTSGSPVHRPPPASSAIACGTTSMATACRILVSSVSPMSR